VGRSRNPNNRGARRALLAANAVGASASGVFAIVGVVRPGYVRPDSSTGPLAEFWAASSAVRTWAVTGPLLAQIARGGRPAPQLLVAAGIIQLMDSALGLWQRNPPMAVLPAVMGTIHLASARILTGDR
jgi:hypothetical protein